METTSPSNTSHTCRSCGTVHTGTYCYQCGEKVITAHDKSFAHIVEELFHFLTHFDGSFFNSIKAIVTRPGKLSLDYANGTRKKYYKPVSLFFLLIVIYLLFPGVFPNGLNMRLGLYMNGTGTNMFSQIAQAKMAHLHVNMDTLAELYHKKSEAVSKLMLLILLPLSAFILMLLYPRKAVFYDNFMLATELNSFFLVTSFMVFPLLLQLVGNIPHLFGANYVVHNFDQVALPIFCIPFIVFCTVAFRRFFGTSWLPASIKAIIFFGLHLVTWLIIYKALLFLTVMALL